MRFSKDARQHSEKYWNNDFVIQDNAPEQYSAEVQANRQDNAPEQYSVEVQANTPEQRTVVVQANRQDNTPKQYVVVVQDNAPKQHTVVVQGNAPKQHTVVHDNVHKQYSGIEKFSYTPPEPPIDPFQELEKSLVPINLIKIFCCYAKQDEKLEKKLVTHLMSLKRLGKITLWLNRDIPEGPNRDRIESQHLQEADLVLVLISPDLIGDENHYAQMCQAMQRRARGEAVVIAVPLRPTVRWEEMPEGEIHLGDLELPGNGNFVTPQRNRDAALAEIVTDISKVVTDLLARKQQNAFATYVAQRKSFTSPRIWGPSCSSCGAHNHKGASICKKCGDLLLERDAQNRDARTIFSPDTYKDNIAEIPSFLKPFMPEQIKTFTSQKTRDAWMKLGDMYRSQGQYLEAIVAYTCAIQRAPRATSTAPAYFNRGIVYLELYQKLHAIADFNWAHQLVLNEASRR